jgi:hypothetical protein
MYQSWAPIMARQPDDPQLRGAGVGSTPLSGLYLASSFLNLPEVLHDCARTLWWLRNNSAYVGAKLSMRVTASNAPSGFNYLLKSEHISPLQ